MRKIYLVGIFILFLQACSDPVTPELIQTVNFTLSSSDYVLKSPGYFICTKDCSLITLDVMNSGAVTVYYKPINQNYFMPLPYLSSESNYNYISNYAYQDGKIIFFTSSTNLDSKIIPFGGIGSFKVSILRKG